MSDQEDLTAPAETSSEVPAAAAAAEIADTMSVDDDDDAPEGVVPELETPEPSVSDLPLSAPPATPNQHNMPSVATVDYDKLLMMSDDEDVYTEGGGDDEDSAKEDDTTNDNSIADMLSASVTSNFTAKFFPPSPARSNNNNNNNKDIEDGVSTDDVDATTQPSVAAATAESVGAPSTPARSTVVTPTGTPNRPPTEYVDSSKHDDEDDVSTLANETIIAKYMMSGIKPNTNPTTTEVKPGSPDISSGASQLSELPQQPPKRGNNDNEDPDPEQNKTEPSSPSKSTVVGEVDNKSTTGNSNYSMTSSYRFFRGGSGWTRRNYMLAFGLTFVLLAIIGGLTYTFVALKDKEDELAREQNNLPVGCTDCESSDEELPDGITFRPTPAPIPLGPTDRPTRAPTGVPSRTPSETPTVRPTKNPTGAPSRRPTIGPSVVPTIAPTGVPSIKPTIAPSVIPTWTPDGRLRDILAEVATSDETLEKIEIPGTPQQMAFEWLHSDPNFMNYLDRRKTQRFALAVLYYSITQPDDLQESLQTWMSYETNECTWFTSWYENRLGCGSDDIFKFLTLRNINLVGTIPPEVTMLTRLESLVLRDNGLTGSIPKEFGNWKSLQNLDLRGNFLSGKLPKFNATDLTRIDLSWNQITGTIPKDITKLPQLEYVDFTENFIYGSVPNQLCSNGLESLGVDCREVSCACCDRCGSEETRFPVDVPPTPPTPPPTPFPTPVPTPPPTPEPTPPPTPGPTRTPTPPPTGKPTRPPTPGPTRPPTPPPTGNPTPPPTPPPTMAPTPCTNIIQAPKPCFSAGEPIVINFLNCNPVGDSWVGIYPDSVRAGEHTTPSLWKYSCNSQSCFQSIGRGSVIMDGDSGGISSFPLANGEYKAWLFNQRLLNAPHPAIIGTTKFIVGGQC